MIVAGFGFKLALVPFHLWTPDVYQGAPAPVTAFVATVSKGAMFGASAALFLRLDGTQHAPVFTVFSILAIASMVAGNLLALLQDNVKRMLAYSSIAHLGYLLVAFLAAGQSGSEAITFYLVAYFVTTLGAFGVVTVLSTSAGDAERLEDYRGLFWRRPALAAVFTAMLFSLAGIPLTAGFVGKFYHRGRWGFGRLVGAHHHSRGVERSRALLLPPHRRGAVQSAGTPAGNIPATPYRCRNVSGPGWPVDLAGSISGSAAGPDSQRCDSRQPRAVAITSRVRLSALASHRAATSCIDPPAPGPQNY